MTVRRMVLAGCLGLALAGPARAEHAAPEAIPVLCYHRFGPVAADNAYAVTAGEFRRHLEIIRAEGFTPVTASRLADCRDGLSDWPEKPLVITVDDGYRDFLQVAKPLLREFGYPATLFIYTQFVGSRDGFSPEDLRTLETEGYEIGSHSATHPKLTHRPRGETPGDRASRWSRELAGSREQLRAWSGGEVNTLAYPYGLWDDAVAAAAAAAGYRIMFTVDAGPNAPDTPACCLHRDMIVHGLRDATFRQRLRAWPLPLEQIDPRPGERRHGPVARITATLAPAVQARLVPGSLTAHLGQRPLNLTYDAAHGTLALILSPPWKRGVTAVTLTATDAASRRQRQASWLLITDADETKGTPSP